jgi:cell wall-associated NlpC family hydrolase
MDKRILTTLCWTFACLWFLASCAANRQARGKTTQGNEEVVREAQKYLGRPYQYGGTGNEGFDCSGLVCTVYKKVGVELPRTASEQMKIGKQVSLHEACVGDLAFFKPSKNSRKVTHVGIISRVEAADKIWFIHASTSRGVIESSLTEGYWSNLLLQIRRIR